MSVYQIRNLINSYESLKSVSSSNVTRMENEINELSVLLSKFNSLGASFSQKQSQRSSQLSGLKISGLANIKSLVTYTNGMTDLLNNNQYKSACSEISQAITKINNQINIIKSKIDAENMNIKNYNSCINNLNKDLKRELSK